MGPPLLMLRAQRYRLIACLANCQRVSVDYRFFVAPLSRCRYYVAISVDFCLRGAPPYWQVVAAAAVGKVVSIPVGDSRWQVVLTKRRSYFCGHSLSSHHKTKYARRLGRQ